MKIDQICCWQTVWNICFSLEEKCSWCSSYASSCLCQVISYGVNWCWSQAYFRYTFCPEGNDSWCHLNRSKAIETAIRKHIPTMDRQYAEKMLPNYDRLSNADLLQHCSRMKTQNANESFNSLILRRCPKGDFATFENCGNSNMLCHFEI